MKKWNLAALGLAGFMTATMVMPVAVSADDAFPYVYDETGSLSEFAYDELSSDAQRISDAYGCGVYIVMLDDFTVDGYTDINDYTEDLYLGYDLGIDDGSGGRKNAEIFVVSLEDRDWCLYTNGDFAKSAIGEYPKEQIEDKVLNNLGDNDFEGGFRDYLSESEYFLKAAYEGEPVTESPTGKLISLALRFLVFPFGLAILICLILNARMKSVKPATELASYVIAGKSAITSRHDRFTHMTTTKTKIERDKSHTSSSGGTSHSGKF